MSYHIQAVGRKPTKGSVKQLKIYMVFQIICCLPENISYLSGAQLGKGLGVATHALFVGGLMCALLAAVFFAIIHQHQVDLLHAKLLQSPRWYRDVFLRPPPHKISGFTP